MKTNARVPKATHQLLLLQDYHDQLFRESFILLLLYSYHIVDLLFQLDQIIKKTEISQNYENNDIIHVLNLNKYKHVILTPSQINHKTLSVLLSFKVNYMKYLAFLSIPK